MFDKTIKFFIENYKINYALFFLLFAVGIYSYTQIPKEVSPTIEPSSIRISGSYSGASVDMLNKMAVTTLENAVKSIVGVQEIISTIQPGRFSIKLELNKYEDKVKIKEEVKDAIENIMSKLPSDMDEPSIKAVAHARSLVYLSLLSKKVPRDKLIELSKDLESKLLSIAFVSDITIFGISDEYYEVLIDDKKLEALGINKKSIVNIISELSYNFPLGKIDDKNNQFFLSTSNGKKDINALENTILKIDDNYIYLKDFAKVTKRYGDASTLASMNGSDSITLAVSQNPKGDAITISKQINQMAKDFDMEDVTLDIRRDYSFTVKESLNVVFSNIIFGIFLITILTYILINSRMAFVIFLGIPTSFVMGAIYFYFTGYSINVNSLIGVLLAIGIIVDDAIVVSENIQQYIEKGYEPKEAAYLGAKEMAKPVFIASLTTLFSFIPLLMISGRMGEIIQLIPIAFSALIFASLIESFIFLPIHSAHILNKKSKTLSWDRIKYLYEKVLIFLMIYKKSFLLMFIIIVPLSIFISVNNSKFQMFKKFDSSSVSITFKGEKHNTLEDTSNLIKQIQDDLLKDKKRFFIKNVSATAGHRRTATGTTELYPYVGNITVELQEKAPDNIFDKYITPVLSIYYEDKGRIRTVSSKKVSRQLRAWLKKQRYKKRFNIEELMVVERRMGATKADVRIGLVSNDYQKALNGVQLLQKQIGDIKGVKYAGNNIKLGIDELKLKINSYGESLGITEKYLSSFISSIYLQKDIGTIYNKKDSYEIKTKSLYSDKFEFFKDIKIPLADGRVVSLYEVCDVQKIQSLEKLKKDNGVSTFYLYANLNDEIVTSSEIFEKIELTTKKLEKEGIRFIYKGERKQKKTLKKEMLLSIVLALTLIFMALLYLFNSIRDTILVISVIPFSMLGLYIGHFCLDTNITVPSLIGAIGLAGVIVNDGIIMTVTLKKALSFQELYKGAASRFRPIILTSITTIVGLVGLIFFASGFAVSFQPMAITIGFGLLWGTILNLLYLPVMYGFINSKQLTTT